MGRWLAFPLVRITLWLAAWALVGYRFGPVALVVTSPLMAAAIARPLMALAGAAWGGARAHVWLPVHGQHYVFKGVTIHVIEDADCCRWVCLADVRKVVGTTAGEGALAVAYPGRVQAMGQPPQAHLRDDALVAHLAKENAPVALRFRTWVERTIAFPARRIREGKGIRVD
ncbi:MAG: hypothetical protein HYX47_00860 [Burkholderiales bacterium]|nr:hypothetical protein [Burkholderiales bacterium]